MRARNASAWLRLLLILTLSLGTLLSSVAVQLHGVPSGLARQATDVQAKDTQQRQKTPKQHGKANGKHAGKNKNGKQRSGGKGNGKHKNKQTSKTPPALDAQSIEAEAVAAFDCVDLEKVRVGDRTYCTHGDDPPMFARSDIATAAVAESSAAPRALCIDDGQSGPRVQLLYVHRNDQPDRLPELLPTFRRLASEMDTILDQSARKTGGSLRIRFVTTGNCQVDVKSIGVPANAFGGFGSLNGKLRDAGYDRLDRKYVILADANVFCGIGTFNNADSPTTTAHNFTGYARVDRGCWDPGTMIHELSHNLGAVQYSAPNTSRGAHCVDEWDAMCYRDEPNRPRMKYLCKDGLNDFRLDCNNDDYFAANPRAGSYLDKHWNMANSIYLTDGSGESCVDAAREPDDAYWYDYWNVSMPKYTVGKTQARAFCDQPGDTDWVVFAGQRGKSYQVETSDLGPDVDTRLVAYRGFEEQRWDSMDRVAVNDDRGEGDPASSLIVTAPHDGTFLVGISEAQERAGYDKTYTLSITEVPTTDTGALTLSRHKAKPKGAFTATMRELDPGADVTFWMERRGKARELGQATAGDDGVASGSYTVAKGAKKGAYQIEGIASDSSFATATLKVEIGGREGNGGKHKGKKGKHGKGGGGKH